VGFSHPAGNISGEEPKNLEGYIKTTDKFRGGYFVNIHIKQSIKARIRL